MPRIKLRPLSFKTKKIIIHFTNLVKYTWAHPANQGARSRALLRLINFQLRGRVLRQRTLTRIGDQSRIWADVHRYASLKVVCANPPDYPEMLVWRQTLRARDLFVDVGANVGSYAIWAADLGADVIALEPADDAFALLMENISLNGYKVDTVHAAGGAFSGVARFTSGRDDWNCLDIRGSVEVPMVTIDSIIGDRTVAGLKVDVEGFEIDVLQGCKRALSEHRIQLMQLEWNATSETAKRADRYPVARLLAEYGYGLYRPDSIGRLVPLASYCFGSDVFARPCSFPGEPDTQEGTASMSS